MNNSNQTAGHIAAFITILIWGTTYASTKLLLVDFAPLEILFFRFVMGYFCLGSNNCGTQLKLTSVLTGSFFVILAYK